MENLRPLFLSKKRLDSGRQAAILFKMREHFVPIILHSPLKVFFSPFRHYLKILHLPSKTRTILAVVSKISFQPVTVFRLML